MNKIFCTALGLMLLLTVACERPESPNFKLKRQVEAPLSIEKTYRFLGDTSAIIDTTKNNFADLFSSDSEGVVKITKQKRFNFGNLNNAIPKVSVAPTSVNTEVGEILISNFSSGTVGEASFQSIAGTSSPAQGQQISGGSGSVNIPFSTEYFKSAVIKRDGSLEITLTNQLGFDIDELEIALNSGSTFVGQTTIGTTDNFLHDTQRTGVIPIPASTQLSDLNVDITASWNDQAMQEEGDRLVVNDATGRNLVASEFTGAPESQYFENSATTTVDQSYFEFRSPDDYVRIGSGELAIDISNNIDVGVDTMKVLFKDIVDPSGNPTILPLMNIPASSEGGSYAATFDLSGYRIKAENGVVDYRIKTVTENIQKGFDSSTDSYRTISETDNIISDMGLNNLEIDRARGYTVPKTVFLNGDTDGDGSIDVFNDNEAILTNIDGISDISDRLSAITFANPIMNIFYNTNLGVNTTVYAVIAGTDKSGDPVFLKGIDGSRNDVESGEIPGELQVNGNHPTTEQVIKFSIDTAETPRGGEGEPGSNILNAEKTNSSQFFSNLPTTIRFVGVAAVNKKKNSGILVKPVVFDPTLGVELPLHFSADNASFKDTVDADLGNLPEKGADRKLTKATLVLNYTNGLPLNMDLSLTMLDANGAVITTKEDISIASANIDNNGVVEQGGAASNKTQITFSESELETLNNTRTMEFDVTINTPQKESGAPEEVKIQEDNTITFRVKMDVNITSRVN